MGVVAFSITLRGDSHHRFGVPIAAIKALVDAVLGKGHGCWQAWNRSEEVGRAS